MGRIIYWIDDYTDETVPCDCTLQGWADWLALSAEDAEAEGYWGRGESVSGAEFATSTMEELEDVEVTRTVDGWTVSAGVLDPTADFFAVRYRPGSRWAGETTQDSWADLLENLYGSPGKTTLIAVCRTGPNVIVRFDRTPDGPTCTVVGTVS